MLALSTTSRFDHIPCFLPPCQKMMMLMAQSNKFLYTKQVYKTSPFRNLLLSTREQSNKNASVLLLG